MFDWKEYSDVEINFVDRGDVVSSLIIGGYRSATSR